MVVIFILHSFISMALSQRNSRDLASDKPDS